MEEAFKISWLGISGISILTFLIGLILGHRLNIHRDQRNRLFELSGELKKYFLSQSKEPSLTYDERIIEKMDIYVHYMAGISGFYKKKAKHLKGLSSDFFNHIEKAESEAVTGDRYIGFINVFIPKHPEPIREMASEILKLLND